MVRIYALRLCRGIIAWISVRWRCAIDGVSVPGLDTTGTMGGGQFNFAACQSIYAPIYIERVTVQAGSVFAIKVIPQAGFDCHLTVIGRIAGRLDL